MNTENGQYWEITDSAFRGCRKVSAGCDNCWAEKMAWRHAHNPKTQGLYKGLVSAGKWTGSTRYDAAWFPRLMDKKKGKVVFFNGMGDLFHEANKPSDIQKCLTRIDMCRQHLFIVATKRPAVALYHLRIGGHNIQNLGLLASVENQAALVDRVRFIAGCKPHVLFTGLSCEPLLGPLDFPAAGAGWEDGKPGKILGALDWIVVGGESAGKMSTRYMTVKDFSDLAHTAAAAGIPLWLKQFGGPVGKFSGRTLKDGQQFNGLPPALKYWQIWGRK